MNNAFTMVRPRGADNDQPPKIKQPNKGRPPPDLGGSSQRALDRNGRRTVPLAPMPSSVHIDSRLESQAMRDKQRKITGKPGSGR